MKKSTIITIIVIVVLLALILIFGWSSLTGSTIAYAEKSHKGYNCVDSDGGGELKNTIYTKGTVEITSDAGYARSYMDGCDGDHVEEYYCDVVARTKFRKFRCENGCVDGACVK